MEGYHQKKKDFHLKVWEGVETVLMKSLTGYGATTLKPIMNPLSSRNVSYACNGSSLAQYEVGNPSAFNSRLSQGNEIH